MMKYCAVLLGLLLGTLSNAQNFELGAVSASELRQAQHPKDTTAVAAFLFRKGAVSIADEYHGFDAYFTLKVRIKIYKKQGYDWANQEVLYYPGAESVSFSGAATYNLVGDKVVKTKVSNASVLEAKHDKYISVKQIIFPDVREGSIIEFQYTKRLSDVGILDRWNFQQAIPVDHSEFTVQHPGGLIFTPRFTGLSYPKRSNNSAARTVTEGYAMTDVPASKSEEFVSNPDNYVSAVQLELTAFNFPGILNVSLMKSWQGLAKTIYDSDDFKGQLEKTGYFEKEVQGMRSAENDPGAKVREIFNFVKTNVKWDGHFGVTCDQGVRKAYKEHLGNMAEINLILVAMLRRAGLEANPVLISTRSNGVPMFPSRQAYNAVIASVRIGEELQMLDASAGFSQPNVLPLRDLNNEGRILFKDGHSETVSMLPSQISKTHLTATAEILPNGTLQGKAKRQLEDFRAMEFRETFNNITQDAYLESLETRKNIALSGYQRQDEPAAENRLVESYNFADKNHAELIGNELYLSPMLFFAETQPFNQQTRENTLDLDYGESTTYRISFQIPKNYTVVSLPSGASFEAADGIASFRYQLSAVGNLIQITAKKDLYVPLLPVEAYAVLKAFYAKIIDKQKEKIILRKV